MSASPSRGPTVAVGSISALVVRRPWLARGFCVAPVPVDVRETLLDVVEAEGSPRSVRDDANPAVEVAPLVEEDDGGRFVLEVAVLGPLVALHGVVQSPADVPPFGSGTPLGRTLGGSIRAGHERPPGARPRDGASTRGDVG